MKKSFSSFKKPINRKAFSLIELSIVILIIGIIIAGVSQSSRLVYQFKLSSARTLTASSPVNSISGLVLWLDATSEESISTLNDGDPVSTWNDINTQELTKHNVAQGAPDQQPIYKKKIINGLPSIKFDGVGTSLYSTNLPDFDQDGLTAFVVLKLPSALPTSYLAVMSKCLSGGGGVNIELGQTAGSQGFLMNGSSGINTWKMSKDGEYIVSFLYSKSSVKGFVNGKGYTNVTSGATITSTAASDYFYVGKSGLASPTYFGGYVSEVILFNKLLTKADRQDIENYLGRKWGQQMTVESSY